MHWGDHGWGIGFGLGWLFMIIFWVLVILGVEPVEKVLQSSWNRHMIT